MTTLDAALELAPDHLSLYALTLDDPDAEGLTGEGGDHLPTTAGARRWRETARPLQDEDRAAAQYHHAVHRLAADGWHGYEISNWARPGHESRHNLAYWERRPYEAVGPGAHAFDGVTRRWNAARLAGYLAALTPADGSPAVLPPGGSEDLGRRHRGRRAGHPGPSDVPRHPGVGRARAAAGRRVRVGHRHGTRGRHGGRPDRPHDPRPPALERAVLAADRVGAVPPARLTRIVGALDDVLPCAT